MGAWMISATCIFHFVSHLWPMRARTWDFDTQSPNRLSRAHRVARLETLASLLDTAFVVPGTKIRFGLDALIGLVPGIGDLVTTVTSLYIVHEAYQLGAPKHLLVRMLGNVALDGFVGTVPLVGDVFDTLWRANRRNVALLRNHFEHHSGYR
jgi:hypothetical protein